MRANHWGSIRRSLAAATFAAATAVLAQPIPGELQLPVPRTVDLTHAEPAHYAAALGKDPGRIFQFVRDQIGHEVYAGALRGPRGTLLAMAGNSVDRAALLASLLEQAGQKTRFARGTLPEARARTLAVAIWTDRARSDPSRATIAPSAAVQAGWDTFQAGVQRDYTLIRDRLKKANLAPATGSAASLDSMMREAQQHYWVQWQRDGAWVDLDPSFSDASPGQKFVPAVETVDSLPENLYHRVEIRLRIEEYTVDKPATRVILTHRAKAADLSGRDVALSHQPENWAGPAVDLTSALASAIADTGRVKPILLTGGLEWIAGKDPYRHKPPAVAGLSAMASMLAGAGTRHPVPIATAASLEFDFIYPDGRKETVTRELFDVVGKERRSAKRNLTADEVKARTQAPDGPQISDMFFHLFFTTGRIDARHVPASAGADVSGPDGAADVRRALFRTSVAFAIVSDSLLKRIGRPEPMVAFYPDSPRLQIVEASKVPGGTRLSLDLRRTGERAVTRGAPPETLANARIFKGVVQGTLERVILESGISASARAKGVQPSVNTSALFERAATEQVPILFLPSETAQLQAPGDTLARVREETQTGGLVALAPQRAFTIGGKQRLAWWRIDPRTGDTVAMTDQGLHEEYLLVTGRDKTVWLLTTEGLFVMTLHSAEAAAIYVGMYLQLGARWTGFPFPFIPS